MALGVLYNSMRNDWQARRSVRQDGPGGVHPLLVAKQGAQGEVDMAVTITVLIDKSPGTLSRVIAALRKFGLTFTSHRLDDLGEQIRLRVAANGNASARELNDGMSKIRGVVAVADVNAVGDGAAPTTRPASRAAPAAANDKLVDDLVNAFPKVLRLITEYENQLKNSEERRGRLNSLGERVGHRLVAGKPGLDGVTTLHDALAKVVVPVLTPISEAEAVGSDVRMRLSVFTRRQINTMDLVMGGEASRCDFMAGLIQGMLNEMPPFSRVRVEETRCRTNGDEHCLFHTVA